MTIVRRVESGWTVAAAARAAGVSRQTASKWVARYRRLGPEGMRDASSRPHRVRQRLAERSRRRIIKARLAHRRGPHWLSWRLKLARSTIYAVLRRAGLSRLKRRDSVPAVRYEWPCPGDLVHLDIKKLGRIGHGGGHRVHGRRADVRHSGIGWDFVHVAIDDRSRLAYAEICPDERGETATAFTERAIEFFASAGIETHRIITDNGSAYCSHAFRDLLTSRGIAMKKTRPYRPQTNGKAEAFIKILINEWAYGRAYLNSAERADALGPFLKYYNLIRPHGGIGGQAPITRVA